MTLRHVRRGGYTNVDNGALRSGLSARAIGVLVIMLSKPPGWRFASNRLANEVTEGRDAIRAAMNELVEAGFLRRVVIGGTKPRTEWWVREALDLDWPDAWESGAGESDAGESGDGPSGDTEIPDPPTTDEPNTEGEGAAAASPSDRVMAVACPFKSCDAQAGYPCRPGRGSYDPRGHHTLRVASVIATTWYDYVKIATGKAPIAPTWPAVRGMADAAVRAGHRPSAILNAITSLHEQARPVCGQTIDAWLNDRQRPQPGRNTGIAGDRDLAWAAGQLGAEPHAIGA